MAVFGTTDAQVLMPRNIADGMITASRSTSVVAKLSGREPQRFGEVDYITFNDFPKAEFVEEGADKASTTGGFDSVTAKHRTVTLDILATDRQARSVTAHVLLRFETTGDKAGTTTVRGRLFLTRRGDAWRIFGYDVAKGAQR